MSIALDQPQETFPDEKPCANLSQPFRFIFTLQPTLSGESRSITQRGLPKQTFDKNDQNPPPC